MEGTENVSRGIFSLPNEILLNIFSLFTTKDLLPFTTTCKHFHSIILRLIHHRLQIAAGLDGHTLYLECHHPSARLTASRLFCTSLGTEGLDDIIANPPIENEHSYVGQIEKLGKLYSRFRPQRREPDFRASAPKHPAGDIPGSRTYQSDSNIPRLSPLADDDIVRDIVTVDAHDLFSQLMTLAYLAKHETRKGLLLSIQDVGEGTIRVWRDWLKKQCESRSFSDESTVIIHHDNTSGNADGSDSNDPHQDPKILWLNTGNGSVGVKFRVKRQKQRAGGGLPLMYSSELEVGVSYEVEYAEVLIRTTHLMLKLEEAHKQLSNESGKAIIFGSYRESTVS